MCVILEKFVTFLKTYLKKGFVNLRSLRQRVFLQIAKCLNNSFNTLLTKNGRYYILHILCLISADTKKKRKIYCTVLGLFYMMLMKNALLNLSNLKEEWIIYVYLCTLINFTHNMCNLKQKIRISWFSLIQSRSPIQSHVNSILFLPFLI